MDNDFEKIFSFPPVLSINTNLHKNPIQHVLIPECNKPVKLKIYKENGRKIRLIYPNGETEPILAVNKSDNIPEKYTKVILVSSFSSTEIYGEKWLRHPILEKFTSLCQDDFLELQKLIIQSWSDNFNFRSKSIDGEFGLRLPQIGALHACIAHKTVSTDAATIVMPTGTGKTDTMISFVVASQCKRVLVVTPTDALRRQIAQKFLTLGILRTEKIINTEALYPIVGILAHKPKSIEEVQNFFNKCNVIVTTMSIAGQCSSEIQKEMSNLCSELFIDEAHHIGARTWIEFKKYFEGKQIFQFTATPFRNDGKTVGGKIIYNYPLGKAQRDGYFRPIKFSPIVEYNPRKSDQLIAEKAIGILKRDRETYDHILMARVDSINRAQNIYTVYKKYSEFNPVLIHSNLSSKELELARNAIQGGKSKIIVCVDMFGEGFDLPELKIAAFHDIKKSLPITLQLAGRFVRSRKDLGEPTFIANIAETAVQEELRKLYSQDADWNVLLRQTSESVIQSQSDLWEYLSGFTNLPEEVPLQNIHPALSTIIYRTKCVEWTPKNSLSVLSKTKEYEQIYSDINTSRNILIIVTGKKEPIDWGQLQGIYNLKWDLLIIYWDSKSNLLYINSSSNEGYYKDLAQSIAGDVELIKGNEVFRSFHGINRLRLQNVGLNHQFGKLIKYTMRAGSDIESGLSESQKGLVHKANIFGTGYEDGRKTSLGCSYKGRIWAHKIGDLEELIKWVSSIGNKILDTSINPDEILQGTLVSQIVTVRPEKLPIWIDWPELFYNYPETAFTFRPENDYFFYLHEADIYLTESDSENDINFIIKSDHSEYQFKLSINERDFNIKLLGNNKIEIAIGSQILNINDFFYNFPPTIYFIDGSTLDGNNYTELTNGWRSFTRNKIQEWDWTDINIRKESQGVEKIADSIQYRVIEKLKTENYDLIFDDDGPGEISDIFAVHDYPERIAIDLFHCKYSQDIASGARVKDLMEVCGQAQKSVRWMERALNNPDQLFVHLLKREGSREEKQESSRIEIGSKEIIETLKVKSRYCPIDMRIFIVQPGLSISKISDEQLRLLGVTENYLVELCNLPLIVIGGK